MGVGGVVKGIGSRVPSHAPSVGRDGEKTRQGPGTPFLITTGPGDPNAATPWPPPSLSPPHPLFRVGVEKCRFRIISLHEPLKFE